MKTRMITVGPFQSNSFLLCCQESGEGAVVDPGWDGDRILGVIEEEGVVVKSILLTHAHIDHVNALKDVQQSTGATVHLHPAEAPLYEAIEAQAHLFGLTANPLPAVDRYVEEGEEIAIGRFTSTVISTPGHSPGGICFHVPAAGLVAVGDALFEGSIGRTDLWGGDHDRLIESIRTKLLTLPPETRVLPGHGAETTIGKEAGYNPFLR